MIKKIIKKIDFHKDRLKNKLWFYSLGGRENSKKLGALSNLYAGKRCFIMGNGPSLLKNDLTLLNGEVTIGSNYQFLIWEERGFIPKFLTVEDRLVAENRKNEINKINNVIKVVPKDISQSLELTQNTIYINFDRHYKNFPKFSEDFLNIVYWGGTVSFLSMQLAYFLGCTEIYLIGFDHSYKLPEKMAGHVITSEADDVNHIHPDYFGKGQRWNDPNLARMELSYNVARKFFDSKGIKIYNATVGGQLEVFERIDYNQLFKN